MKIWIINPYDQTPEQQATRTYEYTRKIVQYGHEVTVIASSFNHYKLIEEKLKWYELWKDEYYEGIRFTWVKTFPYRSNDWRRTLNMLSHAVMAFLVGLVRFERPDIIMGVSVPISSGFAGYVLSLIKRARFIFEVRDLWPESLIDLGLLSKDSPVATIMRKMEYFLYQSSYRIISVLPFAYRYIVNLGISEDKVVWLPNGIDLENYRNTPAYDGGPDFHEDGHGRKFTVMYVGRFGNYQGIEVIVEAARLVSEKHRDRIRYVLIGDGPERERIQKMVEEYGLTNIEFKGLLPKRAIPEATGEADVCIAILKNMDVLKYGINPNKLFDYLASGRPIIFAIKSVNNPVEDAGAGISIPPQDPQALARAIEEMIEMTPGERKTMGDNGLWYMRENYEINVLAKRLERVYMGM